MLYGICVIHSIWRLVIIKWIDKGFKWVDNQVDLLTKKRDFEAEHIIIMLLAITFISFCIGIGIIRTFFNKWYYLLFIFSIIIISTSLCISIYVAFKTFKRLMTSDNSWKDMICFKATIVCDFILIVIITINSICGDVFNKNHVSFYIFSMLTWYELWVISWFLDKIVIVPKYNNITKYKVKIIVWKFIFMILVSVILYLMNLSDTLTIFSIVFTIIISMLDYKMLHVLIEIFSYKRLRRQQRIKLKRYCREKLIPIKIYIYLIEISYIIANSFVPPVVRLFEKMNNNFFYYNRPSLIVILSSAAFSILYFIISRLVRDIINDENKKDWRLSVLFV